MQETHRVCSSGVIFDLEQLVSGKVRESNKPMGKSQRVVMSLIQRAGNTSIVQRSQENCYSIADRQFRQSSFVPLYRKDQNKEPL